LNPDDGTLGGYFQKHERPPAFEGSDGFLYSADIYIEEDQLDPKPFAAAVIFVRWSADGEQAIGHLETEFLFHAEDRPKAKAQLFELTLFEVKEHLERLIAAQSEKPRW